MKTPKYKIDFWLHAGTLGRNEPTLCLYHADATTGQPLLDSLQQLGSDGLELCKFGFCLSQRVGALERMEVHLVSPQDELRIMNIACHGKVAVITVTEKGLRVLREALAKWLNGSEDFGVSPRNAARSKKDLGRLDRESGELWFWGPYYSLP